MLSNIHSIFNNNCFKQYESFHRFLRNLFIKSGMSSSSGSGSFLVGSYKNENNMIVSLSDDDDDDEVDIVIMMASSMNEVVRKRIKIFHTIKHNIGDTMISNINNYILQLRF